MAIQTSVNYGSLSFQWPDANGDAYSRSNQLTNLALSHEGHDHSSGKGLGVFRIQTATAPTASGQVRVNTDDFQWWGSSAAAVQTALRSSLLTTAGDILIVNGGGVAARLGIGSAGQALRVVGGVPAWSDVVKVKTADDLVNNSTALVADTHLQVALLAATTYTIDGVMFYDAAAAADIKFAFDYQTGALTSLKWTSSGLDVGAAAAAGNLYDAVQTVADNTNAHAGLGVGTTVAAIIRGTVVVSTAGTLRVRFAQFVNQANNCTLQTGSWLRAIAV